MSSQNRGTDPTSSVGLGGAAKINRPFKKLLDDARANLSGVAAEDERFADARYAECLRSAGRNTDKISEVFKLDYLPKSKEYFDLVVTAGLEISAKYPRHILKLVPYAYEFSEKDVGRKLSDAIYVSTTEMVVVSRLVSLAIKYDDEYVVSLLSRVNSKNPNKVNLLTLQAEYSNKRQRNQIIRNVPPITGAILGHLPPDRPISVLDGGATQSEIEAQFSAWPAERWMAVGFDPHPDADLSVDRSDNVRMIRTALGAGPGKLRLYHTRVEGASSIFSPNIEYLKHLLHGKATPLTDVMSVIGESEVDAIDLDTWRQEAQVPPFDFIKLNVQGAELEVLQGASETVESCLGLQTEVSFAPMYLNAPVFRDIDALLDRLGFTFFDIRKPTTNGRAASRPTVFSGSRVGLFRWPSRQMTEAHVLYLRDPFRPEEQAAARWLDPQSWLRLAVVAELNGQVDFAMQLCETVLGRFAESFNDGGAALSKDLDAASGFYQEFDRANH